MQLRNIQLFLFLSVTLFKVEAQVTLQKGSLNVPIPIHSYSDNRSKLSFNLNLNYNSGNGLLVDQVSNSIGTGWNLIGLSSITRIVRGQPDDQIERNGAWNDLTKYPPGYLYNNVPVSQGCPTAMNQFPIFQSTDLWYRDNNKTSADRELDYFQFVIGERTGTFVLNKNDYSNAITLGDSRLKIKFYTDNGSDDCRTSITSFEIIDENGILYEFSEREKTRIYNTNPLPPWGVISSGNLSEWEIFDGSFDIPLNEKPFVVNEWHISKVKDIKANREINFQYITQNYQYNYISMEQAEVSFTAPPPIPQHAPESSVKVITSMPPTPLFPSGLSNLTYWAKKLKGVDLKNSVLKKEIKKVIFPDNEYVIFNYNNLRRDLSGIYAISDIEIFANDNTKIFKYSLEQSYFVKNIIKIPVDAIENRWSRLCLIGFSKAEGANPVIDKEPAWKFDYYTGSNSTENFVPPYFFHAKDQSGYYNGDYSGTPTNRFLNVFFPTSYAPLPPNSVYTDDRAEWAKVSLYNIPVNTFPGGYKMRFNGKNSYSKNGLLKNISNPLGGITEYEYTQNYFFPLYDESQSFDYIQSQDPQNYYEQLSTGGVSLSKVIQKNFSGANDKITEYSYNMPDGKSSKWGIEAGEYKSTQRFVFKPMDKYFTGASCNYHYRYAANTAKQTNLSFLNKAGQLMLGIAAPANPSSFLINYILGVIETCLNSPVFDNQYSIYRYHPLNSNMLPDQYKRATIKEYSSNGSKAGSTIYEFTSPVDWPLLIPTNNAPFTQKPRGYFWMYGLPKNIKQYSEANILQETTNSYALTKNDVSDVKTLSCNCEPYFTESMKIESWDNTSVFDSYAATTNGNLKVDFNNIVTGRAELLETEKKTYDKAGSTLTNKSTYTYNTKNYLLASTKTLDGKERELSILNYYPEDYNLNNPSNLILKSMTDANIINVPISSETWQKSPAGISEMLSSTIRKFGTIPNGDYRNLMTYSLQSDKPIGQSSIGNFNPDLLVRNNTLIVPQTEITFNDKGNVIQSSEIQGNRLSSTIYDYNNRLPVATVSNADNLKVAYTSFEADGNGGWNFSASSVVNDVTAPTGKKVFSLNGGDIIKSGLEVAKTYTVSYWAINSGSVYVNGTSSTIVSSTPVKGIGWTLFIHKVVAPANGTITISGLGTIDEVRLYPINSSMSTVTYDPVFGKTAECDLNNRIVYYEYDGLGRLSLVRDQEKNILKKYCYNYQGQVVSCDRVIYSNIDYSGTYYSQYCTWDQGHEPYYVSVPAAMFTSIVSSEVANTLAREYAQQQANLFAVCGPLTIPIVSDNSTGFTYFVELYNTGTGQWYWFESDGNGESILGYIPEGTYDIYLTGDGDTGYRSYDAGCSYYTSGYGSASLYGVFLGLYCYYIDIY